MSRHLAGTGKPRVGKTLNELHLMSSWFGVSSARAACEWQKMRPHIGSVT
jgi:hypothetical protein